MNWIKMSERKPEYNKPVLFWLDDDGCAHTGYLHNLEIEIIDTGLFTCPSDHATHWSEIDPPKEF